MREFFGIVIIIFSSLLGSLCAIAGFGEDLIFSHFLFWVISFPMYIGGQIVRTSKNEFKKRGMHWVKIYVYIFYVLPVIYHLNDIYINYKKDTINSEKYILLNLIEPYIMWFILLAVLLGVRFLNDNKRGLLNVLILCNIIILVGHNYYYFSAYSGIHEELGLVSSDRKGEKYIIPFEEIDRVYVKPYIYTETRYSRGFSKRTSEFFKWNMYFQTKREVIYEFLISESDLDATLRLKEVVMGKGIPFIVEEMDRKKLAYFKDELEVNALNKERYYELFEVNK